MKPKDLQLRESTKAVGWVSFGKGRTWSPGMKTIPLGWCSTEHLVAIVQTQFHIKPRLRKGILLILAQRMYSLSSVERLCSLWRLARRSAIPVYYIDVDVNEADKH